MKYFIDNLRNLIDFALRQSTKFSRKNYAVKSENVENLFEQPERDREIELGDKYNLSALKNETTQDNYCENLYMLDILDKYFPIEAAENLKILDIGSKNWFYAKGEYAFFKAYCANLKITGVELDAHRLYNNFYSRYEVAKFNIKNLPNTEYIADDFLNINAKYDYITWILPFIKKYSHVKWGLPLNYFKPYKLLKHAYNSLNPGGKIFIINQGEEEHEIQQKMLNNLSITYDPAGKIESDFLEYQNTRYGVVVYK